MQLSGKKLSMRVIKKIKKDLTELSSLNIIPKIAIVTAGEDTSWKAYVRRKVKLADELNIQSVIITLTKESENKIVEVVKNLDEDNTINGIIVQRPLPGKTNMDEIINSISREKDIDGFREDSEFSVPVWLAVEQFFKEIYLKMRRSKTIAEKSFSEWLKLNKIVVIGKGETGGKPVIDNLKRLGIKPYVLDSKTQNKEEIIKQADILVSAVGKDRVVEAYNLKKGVILIGIGLHRGEDGKMHGDYIDKEVDNIASYYTPTPGGVGPLNLSYLFYNLVKAAKRKIV